MNSRYLIALLLLPAPAIAHNGVIHEAPHGGIMRPVKNADVEIVLAPKGGVRLYVMDTKGKQLPASAASAISVEIDRPGSKTEYVTMKPDTTGTLWTGTSKPVTDPKSIVRIGTMVGGQSGLIEVPRAQFPNYEQTLAKLRAMRTNLRMALKALGQNRLQSVLTLLGMSVGVAMVVIVSGLGLGAQRRIESQLESAGPTRITIRPGNYTPAGVDTGGQQDSGGGEPGEGMIAAAAGNADEGGAAIADITRDSAAIDARKRIVAVRKTVYRSPPTPLDAAAIADIRGMPGVKSVAGAMEGNASVDAGGATSTATVRLSGFDPEWPEMTGWRLVEGRLPTTREHDNGAPVMLVTRAAAQRLWPDAASPLGQIVLVGGHRIAVAGVISGAGDSQDSALVPLAFVPNALARTLLGRNGYDAATVRTTSIGVTSAVSHDIQLKLRALHRLPDDTADDFRVETQSIAALPMMGSDPRLARAVHSNSKEFEQTSWEEMAKSLRQAGRTFSYLLAGAAAVSLLVGGIGVMNIMLVSVAARTREIGLRMALGARAYDVMIQFLVEAATLAALGGLIGLALGSVGLIVTDRGFHWATATSPTMMVVALAMAAVTGIAFGFGPARRAAYLDPVVALRSE